MAVVFQRMKWKKCRNCCEGLSNSPMENNGGAGKVLTTFLTSRKNRFMESAFILGKGIKR
jgi:hypothetical protein